MLYQVLVGKLPFTGSAAQLIEKKLNATIVPPSQINPMVPTDLERLVLDLLCPDPGGRPKGEQILRQTPLEHHEAPRATRIPLPVPFVGRQDELSRLDDARAALESRHLSVVLISGQAGAGKTALLTHYAQQLRRDPNYVVLSGRCREKESIPFKALDSLIDDLARFLCTLEPQEVLRFLPRDADALARLFLVLRTVPAFAESSGRARVTDDQQRLRQWAFAALRELLTRMGDRYRLVLIIDDAQWGDADSASLLSELLISADPPVLLLMCAYRVGHTSPGAFLQEIDQPKILKGVQCWKFEAGPLAQADAIKVARLALGQASTALREAVVAESRGHAYFLVELAARAAEDGAALVEATSLESLLKEKVKGLGGNERRLLETVAVCGQPIRQEDAFRAARVERSDLDAVTRLRTANLVTITGLRGNDLIDSYHDRVRETVLANLPGEERRDRHLRLAQTSEQVPDHDPEMLAIHLESGGNERAAGHYYAIAGRRAAATTAFEHAARLLARALILMKGHSDECQALRIQLADALANAGRSAEAGRLYKEAAANAPHPAGLELTRKSGYHYAISGHADEAGEAFGKVLRHAGVYFPKTVRGTVAALILKRSAVSLRGLRFKIRNENEVPQGLLNRLDASQAALAGFGLIDLIRAIYFSSVSLDLSLKAGEPKRLIYSLAMEASAQSCLSARGEKKGERILTLCRSLASSHPSRMSKGIVEVGDGFLAFSTGQWRRAVEKLTTAETLLAEDCTGVNWELASIQYLRTLSQVNLGMFSQVARSLPATLKQAEDRGDEYLLNSLRGYVVPFIHLAGDNPSAAEHAIDQVENWRDGTVLIQHINAFMSGVVTQLYQERYAETWEYADQRWSIFRRKMRLFGNNSYSYCLFTRIQAAIAAASVSKSPAALLNAAEANSRTLARLHPRYCKPMVLAARAGIASVRRGPSAAALFSQAAIEFQRIDMPMAAAASRFREGEHTPGQLGAEIIQRAELDLKTLGLTNPRRFALALISAARL